VGVRVDVDRFVNEFLLPPSEVLRSLSGDVIMVVLQTPLAPVTAWPLIAWTSLPAALLAGGMGWMIRRRMAFRGLAPELQSRLGRIEQKHRAARAAMEQAGVGVLPLQERLTAVREGAFTLARQIQDLRDARCLTDARGLEAEVARLQRELRAVPDEAARREGEAALGEKRKTLGTLREMDQAETRCAMRLCKIEAVLESTCLTLRGLKCGPTGEPAEEILRRELDAELAAIREIER
jgi:hypothetical protein